jgi:WD40 repeat protein/predicted Ser/Thr protein kinase
MVASSDSFALHARNATPGIAPSDFEPAEDLYLGDYLLKEEIGHGGMGVVYRAQQLSLGRVVAVKVLLLGRYSSAGSVERFRREAQAVAGLRHPNIVSLYEVGESDGQHFFAMEYVDGRSLAEMLREGPMAPRRAAELVRDVARAVEHAHHQGVLHRDLKPSNVLIDGLGQVRITDFGLAKKLDGTNDLTATGQLVGTPNYLAPEQASGQHVRLGPTTDVYSMGALFYELLTGRPPFLAQSLQETLLRIRDAEPVRLRSLNAGIPADLETICLKCLHKEPTRRYTTAVALAEDLQAWLEQRPIQARPVGGLERAWLWCRRKPRQAAMVLTLMTAVSAGIVGVSWEWRRAELHRSLAEDRSRKLEAERIIARHHLYASDMSAAMAAFKDGNLGAAMRLLERQQPGQRPGPAPSNGLDADLRGFEWRYLWSRVRGDQNRTLSGHSNMVSCLSFSPDGHFLASGDVDGVVKLWDLQSGYCLSNMWQFQGRALSSSFSHDGRYLALGSWEEMRIWDRTAEEWMQVEKISQARALFCPVGSWLALSSERFYWFGYGGKARLWDYSGSLSNAIDLRRSGARLSFSADGRWLASGLEDNQIHIWDVATGRSAGHAGTGSTLRGLALSGDGSWMAAAINESDRVSVWSVPDGVRQADLSGHELRVTSLAASPKADLLASGGEDQKIRLWDMGLRKLVATLSGHGSEVHALAFSQDGEWLASAGKDETVRLWKVEAARASGLLTNVSNHGGLQVPLLTPNGRWLAANSESNVLTLYDVNAEQPVQTFGPNRHPLVFAPDGTTLYSITTGGLMESWDVQTGESTGALLLPVKPNRESRTCLSPDGSLIAVSSGVAMHLCQTTDGKMHATLSAHGGLILGAAFSRDGQRLATVCQDSLVRLWRTADGALEATLRGHKADVRGVDFAPGDRWLATSGHDNLIKIWDLATKSELLTLRGHKASVHGLAFTPDARTLISAGDDSLRLWNVDTWREIGPLQTGQRRQLLNLAANGNVLVSGDAAAAKPSLSLLTAPDWMQIDTERKPAPAPNTPQWRLTNLPPVERLVFRPEEVTSRASNTPNDCLDLTRFYNCLLTSCFHGLPPHDNILEGMPIGTHQLEGRMWDIRGMLVVSGLKRKGITYRFPATMRGIPLARRATRVHFLCGSSDSGSVEKELVRIAFHATDGEVMERPIRVGKELLDWWYPLNAKPGRPGMVVAWTGTNKSSRLNKHGLRLFRVTWENPRPEVPLQTLDLLAAPTRSEFLVLAISVE